MTNSELYSPDPVADMQQFTQNYATSSLPPSQQNGMTHMAGRGSSILSVENVEAEPQGPTPNLKMEHTIPLLNTL